MSQLEKIIIKEIEEQLDSVLNEKVTKETSDWGAGYWFGRLETLNKILELLK